MLYFDVLFQAFYNNFSWFILLFGFEKKRPKFRHYLVHENAEFRFPKLGSHSPVPQVPTQSFSPIVLYYLSRGSLPEFPGYLRRVLLPSSPATYPEIHSLHFPSIYLRRVLLPFFQRITPRIPWVPATYAEFCTLRPLLPIQRLAPPFPEYLHRVFSEIHSPHSPTTYAEFLSLLSFLPIQRLTLCIPRVPTQSFAPLLPHYLSRDSLPAFPEYLRRVLLPSSLLPIQRFTPPFPEYHTQSFAPLFPHYLPRDSLPHSPSTYAEFCSPPPPLVIQRFTPRISEYLRRNLLPSSSTTYQKVNSTAPHSPSIYLRRVLPPTSPTTYPEVHSPHFPVTYAELCIPLAPATYPEVNSPH